MRATADQARLSRNLRVPQPTGRHRRFIKADHNLLGVERQHCLMHIQGGVERDTGHSSRNKPDEHRLGLTEEPRKLVIAVLQGCFRVRLELDGEAVLCIAVPVLVAAKKGGDGIESKILLPRHVGDSGDSLKQQEPKVLAEIP